MWNLRAKTPQQEQATVPWHQVVQNTSATCSCLQVALSMGEPCLLPLFLHWRRAPAKRG